MRERRLEKIHKRLIDLREDLLREVREKNAQAAALTDQRVPDVGDQSLSEDRRGPRPPEQRPLRTLSGMRRNDPHRAAGGCPLHPFLPGLQKKTGRGRRPKAGAFGEIDSVKKIRFVVA
jgi:hypothetical protein